MAVILDAGPLVAFMLKRDRWHGWAAERFKELQPPALTCEAVLTEAAHLTGKPVDVITHLVSGTFNIAFSLAREAAAVEKLLRRYSPRMDLADACVVRLSELHPKARVMTLDVRDFSVYRRNGREAIPLLAP